MDFKEMENMLKMHSDFVGNLQQQIMQAVKDQNISEQNISELTSQNREDVLIQARQQLDAVISEKEEAIRRYDEVICRQQELISQLERDISSDRDAD
ncbi:MAG: hypothetical protein QNJ72_20715 [Pleurocapsa sp. MO_226.B13]|nr:hypothetical protein [Pleurocapsa sp. MO_226.B13]